MKLPDYFLADLPPEARAELLKRRQALEKDLADFQAAGRAFNDKAAEDQKKAQDAQKKAADDQKKAADEQKKADDQKKKDQDAKGHGKH